MGFKVDSKIFYAQDSFSLEDDKLNISATSRGTMLECAIS